MKSNKKDYSNQPLVAENDPFPQDKPKKIVKHKMRRNGPSRAYCMNPGCQAGIETSFLGKISEDLLRSFEVRDCPYVYIKDVENPTNDQQVEYLLKEARKTIGYCNKIIDFWDIKEYQNDKGTRFCLFKKNRNNDC